MKKVKLRFQKVAIFMCSILWVFILSRQATAGLEFDDGGYLGDLDLATSNATAPEIAVAIINWGLTLVGLVLVALIIYGGLSWMLARGNEEELTKARGILKAALIGLLITMSAYGIAQYVFEQLTIATEV